MADAFNGELAELAFVSVLLEVFTEADYTDGGLGLSIDSDVIGELALDTIGGGRLDEKDLSLQLVGGISEHLLVVLVNFVGEQENRGGLLSEDWFNAVFVEVDQAGCLLRLHELSKTGGGSFARVGEESFVEVAENNNAGFGKTVVSSDCVTSVEELEDIRDGWVLGNSGVCSVEFAFKRANVDNSLLDGKLLDGKLLSGQLLRGRTGLLLDPVDDGLLVTATSVVGLLARAADSLDQTCQKEPIKEIILLTGRS